MTNEVTKVSAAQPPTSLTPQNMDQAVKLAEMMSRAKLVPSHLQGSPGDCLLIVEQAMRWNMSPFAVAQCASSIKGKLMFEGKLVVAAVETSGALDGLLDYEFTGQGDTRKIIVSGKRRGEAKPRTVEVALKDAKTDNGMWTKQPDQQLVYHGARVWARRWTPAVMLGVYTREEFDRGEVPEDGNTIAGEAVEITNESVPEAPKRRTIADAIGALGADLTAAQTANAVDEVIAREETQKLIDACAPRPEAKAKVDALVSAALARFAPEAERMET